MHLALGLDATPIAEPHAGSPFIRSTTSNDDHDSPDLSKEDCAREVWDFGNHPSPLDGKRRIPSTSAARPARSGLGRG